MPFMKLALALALSAGLLATTPSAEARKPTKPRTVDVQPLGLNDFHGNLEAPSGSSGRVTKPDGTQVDAGGVEYLATHVKRLEAENRNTL